MSGTKEGSAKALQTIKERYGNEFFKNIGKMGGTSIIAVNPITGKALKGFAINGKASEAGRIGGLKGRKHGLVEYTNSDS